jgi:hypothetical protein
MKVFIRVIYIIIFSAPAIAGDWITVDGGIIEVNLDQNAVENRLWSYLSTNSKREFEQRSTYTYQYQAVSNEVIKIYAMCNVRSKENLHKEFVMVFDGGSCYFEVKYSIKTGEFSELHVNGEA